MESNINSLLPLFKGDKPKYFPRGQIILFQGDPLLVVGVLKEGLVKIYDIDDRGNEKILHILKPGSILPLAFFSGRESTIQWFYSSLTDAQVYMMPFEGLYDKLREDPDLLIYLMNWFSIEMHELLVRVSSLGKSSTNDKLVAALKFLAVYHSVKRKTGWSRVTFRVSHQLLADMSGITRESAAMALKEMKDQGKIRQPRITILEINLPKLIED